MNKLYEDWIANNVTDIHRMCAEITRKMASAFPELTRVRGHIYTASGHYVPHWWLVTSDTEIIDPTESQFPGGIVKYDPIDETVPQPIGKCMNCGELYFRRTWSPACSSACADKLRASFCVKKKDH